ncbi:MAG: transcriptional repressor [Pseudomonadota bacterium]
MNRLEAKLKSEKMRCTEARRQVFATLSSAKKALSVKEIYETMKKTCGTDLVSVYRNLELFQQLGLVHEVYPGRFSLCEHDGDSQPHHVHVVSVCEDCGASEELEGHSRDICKVVNSLKSKASGLENLKSVTLRGLCSECQA